MINAGGVLLTKNALKVMRIALSTLAALITATNFVRAKLALSTMHAT